MLTVFLQAEKYLITIFIQNNAGNREESIFFFFFFFFEKMIELNLN